MTYARIADKTNSQLSAIWQDEDPQRTDPSTKMSSVRANVKNTKKGSAEKKWGKAKRKSAKGATGANGDVFHEIEHLLEIKQWTKARHLIHEALGSDPTDHWLWFSLSGAYHESREYEKAEKCAEHAVALAPNCPLALWYYAGALTMTGKEAEAVDVYQKIRNMEFKDVAYGDHGEGKKWAQRLLNDVYYKMGRLHHWLSQDEQAKISFGKYLHNRKHGVASNYKISEVKKYLADMERDPATKPYSATSGAK